MSLLGGAALAATILDGLLAGAGLDRLLVQLPAFRRVGMRSWAEFSRSADLKNGFFFYPPLAALGTLASVVAAVASQGGPRPTYFAAHAAAFCAIGGLLLTFGAAPHMLRLRRIEDADSYAIRRAFTGFRLWSAGRGALHVAAFVANVWTLATLG